MAHEQRTPALHGVHLTRCGWVGENIYAQARLEPKQHIAIINVTSFINEQGYSLIIDDVIELFFSMLF